MHYSNSCLFYSYLVLGWLFLTYLALLLQSYGCLQVGVQFVDISEFVHVDSKLSSGHQLGQKPGLLMLITLADIQYC